MFVITANVERENNKAISDLYYFDLKVTFFKEASSLGFWLYFLKSRIYEFVFILRIEK